MRKGVDCKGNEYKEIPLGKVEDISKNDFGRLMPLFRVEGKRTTWLCECKCKNFIKVQANHLKDGTISSCGCLQSEVSKNKAYIDITGQKFGELIALKRVYLKELGEERWECQCSCGKITYVKTNNLRSGNTKSCGCNKFKIEDLSGKQFGFWTVIKRAESSGEKHIKWECKCICGEIRKVRGDALKNQRSTSCGCKKSSLGSDNIENILKNNNYYFKKEFCFKGLVSPRGVNLRFDFAIFENNKIKCLIEFDGELHYQSRKDFGGEKELEYRQKCDEIKNDYCIMNKIPLYRIPYYDKNKINITNLFSTKYLVQAEY